MASGMFLGFDSVSQGRWGPFGKAGWCVNGESRGSFDQSLPPWFSAFSKPGGLNDMSSSWPPGDPRRMDRPPSIGGTTSYAFAASVVDNSVTLAFKISATDGSPTLSSFYLGTSSGSTQTSAVVTIASYDGSTTFATSSAIRTDERAGAWARVLTAGSASITIKGVRTNCAGVLLDRWLPHLASSIPTAAPGHLAF